MGVKKEKLKKKVSPSGDQKNKGFVLIITRTLGNVRKLRRVHLGHLKKKIERKKKVKKFSKVKIFSEVKICNIKKPICSYKTRT